MLPVIDLQADESDDIMFSSSDILVEKNIFKTSLDIAARRICGRYDDNTYRQNLTAGLERYLFQNNIKRVEPNIILDIDKCLRRDFLFNAGDFSISTSDSSDEHEAKLYVTFHGAGDAGEFKIFIDVQNQRVYRGRY
jgi:hypothetical protein